MPRPSGRKPTSGRRRRFSNAGIDAGVGSVGLFIGWFLASLVIGIAVLSWSRSIRNADSISIVDTEVGDCFILPITGEDTEIYLVKILSCDEPHDVEVVGRGELNPNGRRAYPADDLLLPEVEFECGDPRRFHDRGFGVLAVAPNELTWEQHSGTYVCLGLKMGEGLVSGRQIAIDL